MRINQEQYEALISAIDNNKFNLGESINAAASTNDSLEVNKLIDDIQTLLSVLQSKKEKLDELINYQPSQESLNNSAAINKNEDLKLLINSHETPEQEYKIGMMLYEGGKDFKPDLELASSLLLSSAESGFVKAQNQIAMMYNSGEGVEENITEAYKWFNKATENNCNSSKVELGLMYEMGNDEVAINLDKAFQMYLSATADGHAYGEYNLATLYENGDGVDKDMVMAIDLYNRSAAQGDAHGMNGLGVLYYLGDNIEKDYEKAFSYFHKAASKGLDVAQNNLAEMYRDGEGINKDIGKAKKYFKLAADQGYIPAKKSLKELQKT